MDNAPYPVYSHDEWFFKKLGPMEVEEFQDYAKLNDPANEENWAIYHPVCREVWAERGLWPSKYSE